MLLTTKQLQEFYKIEMENIAKNKSLLTNFNIIDNYANGLKPKQLYFLAARPGVGKTSFALNIIFNALENLKEDECIVLFSLEMDSIEIYSKLLALANSCSLKEVETNSKKIDFEDLNKKNLFIFDRYRNNFNNEKLSEVTPDIIYKSLNSIGLKIKAVFIDYFQLLDNQKYSSEREKLSQCSKQLKELSKIFNCNFFVLSQLSREYEKKTNNEPSFSDLKGTGSIEQDADLIMFLYNSSNNFNVGTLIPNKKTILNLSIAKNRNGELVKTNIDFIPHLAKFIES
ncbi:DnaB-like helicase C-terminal domain-containing protein [Mycoplasmopsis fermentans]|uniref:SF4 helicase domain-containing protein n=2 Tax=Mycoplasmopsis fermentans TaxID=2115 RepID=C4XDP9_MYCFP|nr:DnaB-like helicase C-terminal domain-containing protein [Mycoplasmopsis fermentans]YP_044791.1 repb [Mycoplasma phage phiMFV1]VEU66767.1 repb [Mesomycoplasma conjunctivae]AAT65020.1 RepB [Mycoplasma phage phiMFV1]AAT65039.1 RepB [Mycoplasma phage phiMFV1]AAT65059.1 RepB [Mycoplasma phage phiMFV1]ADV34574.1 RepB [Mycoplasmopsis fermentans M64]